MDKTIRKEIFRKLSGLRHLARRLGNPISPKETNTLLGMTGFNRKSDEALLEILEEVEATKFQSLATIPIRQIRHESNLSTWSDDPIDKFKTFLKLMTWGHRSSRTVKTNHISKQMRDKFSDDIKRAHLGNYRVQIEHDVLNSLALRSLKSAHSVRLLLWFYQRVKLQKNKFKRGKNRWTVLDKGIKFTYMEGELLGMSRKNFAKSLRELISRGFIEVEKRGSKERHDASIYKISDRWRKFVKAGFEQFSQSSTISPNFTPQGQTN